MKNIWLHADELKESVNWIYGDGWNAQHMTIIFEKHGLNIKGFIRAYGEDNWIMGKPVVSLESVKWTEDKILLTQDKWQDAYDKLVAVCGYDRVYTIANWENSEKCIVCDSSYTMEAGAEFVPFLKERMFGGVKKETAIVHCSNCGVYYSKYRPSDREMDLLYSGYRNDVYQKMRQKYEPDYTQEVNCSLVDASDGKRKQEIYEFISSEIDLDRIKTVLDFGGDKGQFIPDQFSNKRRMVYDISGAEVINGVTLLTDYKEVIDVEPSIVFCNMMLEHVSDVKKYFIDIVRLVANQGYLYVEVPNERWFVDSEYVRFHEHITFFSEKTFFVLSKIVDGISIVKIKSDNKVIRVLFKKAERKS